MVLDWARRLRCSSSGLRCERNWDYRQSKKIDCVFRKLNALHVISSPLLPNTHAPDRGCGSAKSRRCRSRRLRLKGLIYRKAGSTRCYLTPTD